MAGIAEHVYGEALFAAGMERHDIDELYEEAQCLIGIWEEHPDWDKILRSPQIPEEEKTSILHQVFSGRVSPDMLGLIMVMYNFDRQQEIPAVLRRFILMVEDYKGIRSVLVTSAIALNKLQKAQIRTKLLSAAQASDLEIKFSQDPDLIGGLIIQIGDKVLDGSMKTQLDEMKKSLSKVQLM